MSFVLQRTTTELTPVRRAEALAFFNTSKFADQKRIFTKHGEELCGQSHVFSKFIDKINAEKEETEQQQSLKDGKKQTSDLGNEEHDSKN